VVSEENDRGLCLHVTYRRFDLATCGDIDGTDDGARTDVETPAAAAIGDVEFARVNHHGSAYSSNPTWVSTLSAEAAVITIGKNSYGHPDPGVVARWEAEGDVYQTQNPETGALVDGDVTVASDGETGFSVSAETGRAGRYALDPLEPA